MNRMGILYDSIGRTYAQTRGSDSRITARLLQILSTVPLSTVVDIGAGTGSYATALAEQGYRVLAVEPSGVMREQAVVHPAIQWIDAVVENVPLPNGAADAAIVMLACHHFQDCCQAFQEMQRITEGGPIILFTYDPDKIADFWLTQYFPALVTDVRSTFMPIPELVSELQSAATSAVTVEPFALPHDLSDAFAAVGWARPELYLDPAVRSGISSFAKMTTHDLEQGLSALRSDLRTGVWEQRYGTLCTQSHHDVGYRFVYTAPLQTMP
jgi:ubiquinone/menaquinone biosynthesis C-methylase UbiE